LGSEGEYCRTRVVAAPARQEDILLMLLPAHGPCGRIFVGCLAASLLAPAVLYGQQGYRIAPPAAWVTPIAADLTRPPPKENLSEGYELLLVDHQELVTRRGLERFHHVAYRLLTDGAVEDKSQISIDFSPAYQAIALNRVTVTRNGRIVNQLKLAQIRVAQREANLESHIIEGSKTLTVVLEDVKPGDVVEYSYTRIGANPVFAGHYMVTFSTRESVPIHQFHYRILAPRDRVLLHRSSEPVPEPAVTDRGDMREYLWAARDVPPRLLDPDLPDWYDPMPTVRVTDYATWSAVAAWADSLFVVPAGLPPRLAARVERIRADERSPESRVVAALRFVQDSIRYVGIEIGANSHRPFPPAMVLERGFGDCKDKVLLLVTMLRALGLDARPALVSTAYRDHVRGFLPTSGTFDHAIVRVEAGGKSFWVDPTALYQRGSLEAIAPAFGAALVVGPTVDSLTAIPHTLTADPVTEVSVRLDLAAVDEPASMRVETTYSGTDADQVRARLRSRSVSELAKQYADYYAKSYPGITVKAQPTIDDNETKNVVRTVEQYIIPAFWQQSKNRLGYLGTLDPLELADVVPSVTSANRSMPLWIGYPVHYRYSIAAYLDAGWGIPAEADTVTTPGIRFIRSQAVEGKAFVLRYDYQSLADYVPPSLAPGHLEKVSRIRDHLAFNITPPAGRASAGGRSGLGEVNLSVLLLAGLTLALATFGAVRLRRSSPPRWFRNVAEPDDKLAGLGGWLILVGLNVCIRPVLLARTIVSSASYYSATFWANHTVPGGINYDPLWAPTLLYELVANLALLVFGSWLVLEFFQRRRRFPSLFILLTAASLAVDLADGLIAHGIPAVQAKGIDWVARGRELLFLLVWSLYMVKSRRVRSTFVN
jgi:hypothetical protein